MHFIVLGSETDHQSVEYNQYYPMQLGSPTNGDNQQMMDMEDVASRSRGSSSGGARSKRRYAMDK